MDKKAIKILLKTIKTSQDENLGKWFYWDTYMKYITEEEFEYAKRHSVMYDQESISHNEICKRIKIAVNKIDKQSVVNAFLYSLSTRQLEYRSFLSSYCIGKSLNEHDFTASLKPNETICAVCGLHTYEFEKPVEFNTINYFKYKYGSCTDHLISVLFDVEQFPKLPIVKPNNQDYKILNQLRNTIEMSELDDRISQLKKNISSILKSNNEERLGILEIFGIIGILHDDNHFGYAEKYITYSEREHRPIRNDDVRYPSRWWKGRYGIDNEKWSYWFDEK
jgi:hypothetical protein